MMYFSPAQLPAAETDRLLLSFCLALALHVGLFIVLARLESVPELMPLRIEAQLAQMRQELPSVPVTLEPEPPAPKPVEQKKPVQKPRETTKQLLTAKDDAPPTPEDITVPENPAPPEIEQEPVQAAPANPPAKQADTGPVVANNQVIEANAETEEADPIEAWNNYGQLLHSLVSKNKMYPQIAIRRNLQGTAMVSARFNRGRLVALVLLDPASGHKVLDDAALEMLKKAVNALPVKGDLAKKSFTIIVPVDFKLEG